ncbi:MAG: CGNR zinc finger domain-containing protein [Gammaproteobacteria bacterium]|nr:CGNR zinc finger domain-containing protein [Gammaproteobacteria bacterium]MBV9620560.1 CGNR zinc finger domain-containing protein [Gammaproteobacteria bacterium]
MSAATPSRPRPFELSGGNAALDLVNTLDDRFASAGPLERLPDYADLLRFTCQSGLLEPEQARSLALSVSAPRAARALGAAHQLREALAGVLYAQLELRAPPHDALLRLEQHFKQAARQRHLHAGCTTSGGAVEWRWGPLAQQAETPVWMLAQTAADLLLSPLCARVRACEAETCRWLFLDASKSHTRRWCDMKICGNRMKARRFQERHP